MRCKSGVNTSWALTRHTVVLHGTTPQSWPYQQFPNCDCIRICSFMEGKQIGYLPEATCWWRKWAIQHCWTIDKRIRSGSVALFTFCSEVETDFNRHTPTPSRGGGGCTSGKWERDWYSTLTCSIAVGRPGLKLLRMCQWVQLPHFCTANSPKVSYGSNSKDDFLT